MLFIGFKFCNFVPHEFIHQISLFGLGLIGRFASPWQGLAILLGDIVNNKKNLIKNLKFTQRPFQQIFSWHPEQVLLKANAVVMYLSEVLEDQVRRTRVGPFQVRSTTMVYLFSTAKTLYGRTRNCSAWPLCRSPVCVWPVGHYHVGLTREQQISYDGPL